MVNCSLTVLQARVKRLESDLAALEKDHAELGTELKITKRERDEFLTQKVELQLESKKLRASNLFLMWQAELGQVRQESEEGLVAEAQTKRGWLFGAKAKARPSLVRQRSAAGDEELENEQKEVIKIMQEQIQVKV